MQQVYDHQGNHGQGTTPLLAIDAWEHAFYLQYKNVKADFFDAVWNVFNWDDIARRLAATRGGVAPEHLAHATRARPRRPFGLDAIHKARYESRQGGGIPYRRDHQ